ncbi:MAG: hypothetical protein R2706_16915 [Acidimicrobiales bacterium]
MPSADTSNLTLAEFMSVLPTEDPSVFIGRTEEYGMLGIYGGHPAGQLLAAGFRDGWTTPSLLTRSIATSCAKATPTHDWNIMSLVCATATAATCAQSPLASTATMSST